MHLQDAVDRLKLYFTTDTVVEHPLHGPGFGTDGDYRVIVSSQQGFLREIDDYNSAVDDELTVLLQP